MTGSPTGPGGDRRVRPPRAVLRLNGVGLAAAVGFAAVGALRPGHVSRRSRVDALSRFWAASSLVRTLGLAAPAVGPLLRGRAVPPRLLVTVGIVQLGDSVLGVRRGDPAMAVAPAAMGTVHLLTALILSRAANPHPDPQLSG